MSRCSRIVAATILLIQSASFAVAGELICRGAVCVEGEYHEPFHGFYHFHPRLRDGIPMVQNSQDYYDGYHGTGCIWTERVMPTPSGPMSVLVPICAYY